MEVKWSIKEVAQRLEVAENTVRMWEEKFNLAIPRFENDRRNRRYYTEKELKLLQIIKNMNNENKHADEIEKYLLKEGHIQEQEKAIAEQIPMNQITPQKLMELFVLEQEKFLQTQMDKLKEDMREEIRTEIRAEFEREKEQKSIENQKLLEKIEEIRTEKSKGLFQRIFQK